MKALYANEWDEYQFKLSDADVTSRAGNYKAPSKEIKVSWISRSWTKVKTETIINGFKVYQPKDNPI